MDNGKSGSMPIHKLAIADAFDSLKLQEQLYVHHLAKTAWSGTRIILRQVSPESNTIFDLIMQLYETCKDRFEGKWHTLADACNVPRAEIDAFLRYAATFLSNVGDFFVRLALCQQFLNR